MTGVAGDLAGWASAVTWEALPDEVRAQARLVVLDTFGSLLLGGDHEEPVALARMILERDGPGVVSCVAGPPLGRTGATLVNAVALGIDLLDGGNVASGGHVAGYVLPALLAEAEVRRSDLGEVLASFVVAHEVAARIGAAQRLRPSMHPSGTWNVIGAAAGVAHLRGADRDLLQATIELAANLTFTTSWDATVHGATVRDLYQAMPSFMGGQVADLASVGFRGGPRSVEVTFGELSSTEPFDGRACVADLGESWLLDATYLKIHPTCRSFHAVIDAALEASAQVAAGPWVEREVTVGADPFTYQQNAAVHHDTPLAARESLPVSAALALVTGSITPAQFREEGYREPEVLHLARRIRLVEQPRATPGSRPGWVQVREGGRDLVRCEVDVPRGDPARPLGEAAVREKFALTASRVLGDVSSTVADALLDGPVDAPCAAVLRTDRW